MESRFKRKIDSLDDIFEFLRRFFVENGLSGSLLFPVNLAVEELFTNMVKYNFGNKNDIPIALELQGNRLIVTLRDIDVEPFDVSRFEKTDQDVSIKESRVGGWGLQLVKRIMDNIDYQYRDRISTITLTKELENSNA